MTLDDVVSTFRLPEPHHLKIDVDGAEERVLAGARRTLKSSALRSVLIEADNTKWSAIVKQLETAGLALDRRIARDTKKSDAPAYGLFIRPSRTKRDHLFAWWPRPRTADVS